MLMVQVFTLLKNLQNIVPLAKMFLLDVGYNLQCISELQQQIILFERPTSASWPNFNIK